MYFLLGEKHTMGRNKFKIWKHVMPVQNCKSSRGNMIKSGFKCNYCHQVFSGGAPRINIHLGKIKGHGIKVCENVSQVQEGHSAFGLAENRGNSQRP